MPGPAARVADMTAHGGVILPPGVPTVLIGGMPAATITSMHVCPLITVLVPHVGGPILPPGVPTVLIGGLPAATVGDMATCVGPPDVIIPPGCPTVLIGTSGGGSSGGGGGAAQAASDNAHASLVGEPGPEAVGPHWIEYQFVDSAGNPVTGVKYAFTDVQDYTEKSILTQDGVVRRGNLPDEGECNIILFNVTNAQWSTNEAQVGDVVTLTAETEGYEDGTKAIFKIWERDVNGADDFIAEIETTVDGGKVEAEWAYEYHEDTDEISESDIEKGYSLPEYYFVVQAEEGKARSDLLRFKDWIEIDLKDPMGNPMPDQQYVLRLRHGSIKKGTLNANGFARIEDVPPGKFSVEFPGLGFVKPVASTDEET